MDKRARMVRNHAYVMMKLRQEQRKEYFVQQILFWDQIRFKIFSPFILRILWEISHRKREGCNEVQQTGDADEGRRMGLH